VHPDSSLQTIAHHDLPLRDARLRGTPEHFVAQFIMVSWHLASRTYLHTRRDKLFSHHHPQHPYSRAYYIIHLYNYTSNPKSDTGGLLGSAPATRRYKVRPCRMNTDEIATYCGGGFRKAERGCWRSQDPIADSSTTAWPIPDLRAQRRWA